MQGFPGAAVERRQIDDGGIIAEYLTYEPQPSNNAGTKPAVRARHADGTRQVSDGNYGGSGSIVHVFRNAAPNIGGALRGINNDMSQIVLEDIELMPTDDAAGTQQVTIQVGKRIKDTKYD